MPFFDLRFFERIVSIFQNNLVVFDVDSTELGKFSFDNSANDVYTLMISQKLEKLRLLRDK